MLVALTLKEAVILCAYLINNEGFDNTLETELVQYIQRLSIEEEEEIAHMEEIWKIQYEPFLKGIE